MTTWVQKLRRGQIEVSSWFERDRASIVVQTSDGRTVAEWWDDYASQMFEDGFFKAGRRGVNEESVAEYLDYIGWKMPRRKRRR